MKFNRPLLQRIAGWSVLVIVPLLLFARPILRGEILVPTDILPVIDDVWADTATPHNPLLSDILLQFYPWQKFIATTIAHGQIPLWNPLTLAGTPFLANDQTAMFEPLRLLTEVVRFPVQHSFLFLAVTRLILFGFFTAWWLRRRFTAAVAITIGALAMLSAPAIVWVSYPLFATFLWLPLLLAGLDAVAHRERRGWWMTIGAIAAQWFSGNIQISIFLLLFSGAYALYVLRPAHRQLLSMVLAIGLGTGIAAVQLLPTAAYVRQSAVYETGRGGYAQTNIFRAMRDGSWRGWTSVKQAKQSLERLLPIVSPFVNGNPASGKYRFPGGDVYANMNELAGSIGAIGVLFAIFGIFTAWRERLVRLAAGVTVLAVGMIAHVPIFELLNTLPLLNTTQTDRLRFLIAFCGIIFAAFGLRAVLEWRVAWKKFLVVAGGWFLLLTLVGWKLGVGTDWKQELVLFVISGVFMMLTYSKKVVGVWRSGILAAALLVGPMLLWQNYNTSVAQNDIGPTSAVVAELQRRLTPQDRFVSFGLGHGRTPLEPNTAMVYGLQDVRGYDVVRLKRYDELVDGVLTRSGSHVKGATQPSEILDSLAVRYGLVAARDLAALDPILLQAGWNVVTEDENVRLYENPLALPRAWFTTNVREVVNGAASQAAVHAADFSADLPVLETGRTSAQVSAATKISATIKTEEANSITIQVTAPAAGYLIIADTYAAGWKAFIDSHTKKILIANHALRAVAVPAGQHTVTLRYQPQEFLLGLVVTLGSILLAVAGGLWIRRKKD